MWEDQDTILHFLYMIVKMRHHCCIRLIRWQLRQWTWNIQFTYWNMLLTTTVVLETVRVNLQPVNACANKDIGDQPVNTNNVQVLQPLWILMIPMVCVVDMVLSKNWSTLIHKRKTKMSDPRTAKVVVLGRSGVGKTCLAVRLIEGHFDNSEVSSH